MSYENFLWLLIVGALAGVFAAIATYGGYLAASFWTAALIGWLLYELDRSGRRRKEAYLAGLAAVEKIRREHEQEMAEQCGGNECA